jgi:hypothetical protein
MVGRVPTGELICDVKRASNVGEITTGAGQLPESRECLARPGELIEREWRQEDGTKGANESLMPDISCQDLEVGWGAGQSRYKTWLEAIVESGQSGQ